MPPAYVNAIRGEILYAYVDKNCDRYSYSVLQEGGKLKL